MGAARPAGPGASPFPEGFEAEPRPPSSCPPGSGGQSLRPPRRAAPADHILSGRRGASPYGDQGEGWAERERVLTATSVARPCALRNRAPIIRFRAKGREHLRTDRKKRYEVGRCSRRNAYRLPTIRSLQQTYTCFSRASMQVNQATKSPWLGSNFLLPSLNPVFHKLIPR